MFYKKNSSNKFPAYLARFISAVERGQEKCRQETMFPIV